MARLTSQPFILTSLLFIVVVSYFWTPAAGIGRMVGGRTEIKDVKTNKEVQQLGRFSVEEYNRSHGRRWREAIGNVLGMDYEYLTFSEVVEAQKQVVSGFKYYLKIAATRNGVRNTFDAVVVVKPWLPSKQLLHFSPSSIY
ncbi:Cysteine proteinase inhibitor 2 [Vitis vinifera]|uniref:Cysteine proteinase inhibitor 2 n=1 Tax=Vitis vinifera TaxID=29760 RepID=A0A438DY70_VITVI|nr:Cysteine proteinase inhibitor 2 [Vitis vinifera]